MLVPLSLFAAGCGGAGSSPGSKTESEKAEMKKKIEAEMQSKMKEGQMKMQEGMMSKKGKAP
jgi:hypothetical protein